MRRRNLGARDRGHGSRLGLASLRCWDCSFWLEAVEEVNIVNVGGCQVDSSWFALGEGCALAHAALLLMIINIRQKEIRVEWGSRL